MNARVLLIHLELASQDLMSYLWIAHVITRHFASPASRGRHMYGLYICRSHFITYLLSDWSPLKGYIDYKML